MLKKTVLSLATVAAIGAGTLAMTPSKADAGIHIKIGGPGWGHGCFWRTKLVKVKYWTKWGPVYKWVYRPVRICW